MADHDNKQAIQLLITGATESMGLASPLLAAQEGYDLILADLSQEKPVKLATECAQHKLTTRCQVLDVTQAAPIDALVTVLKTSGGVNVMIHTVGLWPQMAASARIIDVDLVGTVARRLFRLTH